MFSDKRIINFKKLKYKYPNDFEDFILMLKYSYYESLPINNLQKIIQFIQNVYDKMTKDSVETNTFEFYNSTLEESKIT